MEKSESKFPKIIEQLVWYSQMVPGTDWESFYSKTPVPVVNHVIKMCKETQNNGFMGPNEVAHFKANLRMSGVKYDGSE